MKLFKNLFCKAFALVLVLFAFINTAKAYDEVYDMSDKEVIDTISDFNDANVSGFDVDDRIIYRTGNTEVFFGVGYDDVKSKENDNLRYLKNSLQERDILDYVSGSIGVKYMW